MSKPKKNACRPLLTSKSESWITSEILNPEGKEKLQKYLLRFVTESEAIGVTRTTKGFIDDLRINTTGRATSFLTYMCLKNGIDFRSFNSPASLANGLEDNALNTDRFINEATEFVYLCCSPVSPVIARIKQLAVFDPSRNPKKGKRRQNKSEFYRLDAVFRHLRNAFAHGQFRRIVQADGTVVWALQDSNTKGRVTARALVKETTLDSWYGLLMKRDKRYQEKRSGGNSSSSPKRSTKSRK